MQDRCYVLAVIGICIVPALMGATLDAPFQAKVFANLPVSDSVINIGNTGASGTGANPLSPGGNLCVNVYVFSPDEQEIACCTCLLTPNAVQTMSARQLVSRPLTPSIPSALTVKLLATASTAGIPCNAAAPGTPAQGLIAFGTTLHAAQAGGSNMPGTFAMSETAFVPATLSAPELLRITSLCGFIQANGSGFGVCTGCTFGAAGAVRQ